MVDEALEYCRSVNIVTAKCTLTLKSEAKDDTIQSLIWRALNIIATVDDEETMKEISKNATQEIKEAIKDSKEK